MPVERFYLDDPLLDQSLVKLEETEFHHLVRVLRGRVGDEIELVNGKGILAQAKIKTLQKTHALVEIESIQKTEEHSHQLILAQALPKPNRLDFILEKGTELGVTQFWLFPGEQSAKKDFFPNQMERAKALTIAAMKQCGRLTLPEIIIKPALKQWSSLNSLSFFGDVLPSAPLLSQFQSIIHQSDALLFIVGPESGFSQKETEMLISLQAKGVKLHHHILRTDTAAIASLSLLSHWMM